MKQLIGLLILLLATNVFAQTEKLIFSLDLIRHGDRTPIATFPNLNYTWPEGRGQLTKEGMQQEIKLGKELRQRYLFNTDLLPKEYDYQSIYVQSTNVDRTIMSASSLLLGLYPSARIIPIHTFVLKDSKMDVANTLEWQAKTKENLANFKRWGDLIGAPITHLNQMKALGDIVYIYKLHHIPLPLGLTKNDANHIMALGEWAFVNEYKSLKVSEVAGRPVLSMIMSYLQQARNANSPLKFVLIAAHDSTIMSVATLLNAPLTHVPHYASDMNFSLYKLENGGYIVRVSLNNQPLKTF